MDLSGIHNDVIDYINVLVAVDGIALTRTENEIKIHCVDYKRDVVLPLKKARSQMLQILSKHFEDSKRASTLRTWQSGNHQPHKYNAGWTVERQNNAPIISGISRKKISSMFEKVSDSSLTLNQRNNDPEPAHLDNLVDISLLNNTQDLTPVIPDPHANDTEDLMPVTPDPPDNNGDNALFGAINEEPVVPEAENYITKKR